MNFKKAFAVAKWEYLEKVKTKTFIISLFLTPLILILFTILPTFLAEQETRTIQTIGIIDTSGVYLPLLRKKLESYRLPDGQPNYLLFNLSDRNMTVKDLKASADSILLEGRMEGYVVVYHINKDSLQVEFRSKKSWNRYDIQHIEEAFNEIRLNLKLTEKGIDSEIINLLSSKINVRQVKVEEPGVETSINFLATFFSSIVFLMLLMMIIIYSGGMLIRSLVEEKSSRLIEILISSCTPDELITGKIFGLAALGITQIFIWSLVSMTLLSSSLIPPQIFNNILPILMYFLLGFIFYTSIFVGVGSIVTSEQEAQMITSYLSIILIFPVVFSITIFDNPDSSLINIMMYIPLTIPSVMILKLNITPVDIREIMITVSIMLLSIYITILVSAKIFRIGILSYGKRPGLKELLMWLKMK